MKPATLVLMLIGCCYCLPLDDKLGPTPDSNLIIIIIFILLIFADLDCYATSTYCSGAPIPTHSKGHCCNEIGGKSYADPGTGWCHECEEQSGTHNLCES